MATELRPGQPVIYRNIDAYPNVSRLRATVVQVAPVWTTGVEPVQIRVRGSLRLLWVARQLLEPEQDQAGECPINGCDIQVIHGHEGYGLRFRPHPTAGEPGWGQDRTLQGDDRDQC